MKRSIGFGLSSLLCIFTICVYVHAVDYSFTGSVDDDWHNAGNWTPGGANPGNISSSDQYTVGSSFTPLINGTVANNGVITNAGTITHQSDEFDNYNIITVQSGGSFIFQAYFYNSDLLTIESGGSVTNTSEMFNYSAGWIDNHGTLDNFAWLDQYGTITNQPGAQLTNQSGSHIYNNVGASLDNIGNIDNYGSIYNDGDIDNNIAGIITIESGGSLNCSIPAFIDNYGIITNNGTCEIRGLFWNQSSGVFGAGDFMLAGQLINDGNFNHLNDTMTVFGTGTAELQLSTATVFFDVDVQIGAVLWESISDDYAVVSNVLTNNGTIRKTKSMGGTGVYTLGLTDVSVDVTVPGGLTQMEVDRIDSDHPEAYGPLLTGKYWSISPDFSGYTLDLTLPHSIIPDTNAYCARHEGGEIWTLDRSTSTSDTVTLYDVTDLSDWTVSDGLVPTSTPSATPTPSPTATETVVPVTGTMGSSLLILILTGILGISSFRRKK